MEQCECRSAAASRRLGSIEEHNDSCYIVRDATGQALGYFYFEDEPGRRSAAKLLTRDEARGRAENFAKLPKRCGRSGGSILAYFPYWRILIREVREIATVKARRHGSRKLPELLRKKG